MKEVFRAIPCPCGFSACRLWTVATGSTNQTVRFTEEQAKAVAEFMNGIDWDAAQPGATAEKVNPD